MPSIPTGHLCLAYRFSQDLGVAVGRETDSLLGAESKFAADHGVTKIAFEMHPGFMVYNPYTLLKLREAVGPSIGATLTPAICSGRASIQLRPSAT